MIETLLIRGGTLLSMAPERPLAERADLVIENGRISRIGEGDTPPSPCRVIDARGCAVTPGLIQTHVHLCQTLFRGMADELPLMRWLRERIWPLEGAHDARSMAASARLGLAELLLGGTTTILDMGSVHHQDAIFRAMGESGIRGFSGKAMMDLSQGMPKGLRESRTQSMKESLALAERWHGKAGGRLHYAFAPRFILSCSERLLREVGEASRELDLLMHSHVAEHASERAEVRAALGVDDVQALASYGICGPRAVLAHGVQLSARQMKTMAREGTRLTHCPSANMKLASGIADLKAMTDAGLEVGIGADGAPCNNRLDVFTELRQAALLAKVKRDDAAAISPHQILSMATLGGARVLGLDREVGSLEVGKRADVSVIALEGMHSLPAGDVATRLVYSGRPSDVRHVFVNGRQLVKDGCLTSFDEEKVRNNALRQAPRVQSRAGLRS